MKRISNYVILIPGILLFLVSYQFDEKISIFFKNIKFPIVDSFLSIITNFGVVLVIALVIPSIILYKKKKRVIYLLCIDFLISFVLSFIVKLIILRQRPIEAFTYPFINIINYSFPSMHSMVAFSLLPVLLRYLPKQKHFWILFVFLVAISRIYFGFHFLSDVIFGALFGYFIGNFLLELYEKDKLWKK